MDAQKKNNASIRVKISYNRRRVAQLDKRRSAEREVGDSDHGWTNTQGLKIEENVFPLMWHLQMLDILVFYWDTQVLDRMQRVQDLSFQLIDFLVMRIKRYILKYWTQSPIRFPLFQVKENLS